jgi:hypothetical protein
MKITNKHGLPNDVFNVLASDIRKPELDYFTASQFSQPPMMRHLTIKHWDEIEVDASDSLFALLGKMGHRVFELEQDASGVYKEHRITTKIDDFTISGQIDKWDNGHLKDVKFTSVWAFIYGNKPEWVLQTNIYKYLWDEVMVSNHGVKATDKISVYCFFRDWMSQKARSDSQYPQIPFMEMPIPMMPQDEIKAKIRALADEYRGIPRPCTKEERWEQESKWALMKKGRKTAIKLFTTPKDAENAILEPAHYVEERPASARRCHDYCTARPFCSDYKSEGEENAD